MATDPQKLKAQKARWYAKHKAEIARKTAERIAKNPEKKAALNKAWRAANRDKKAAYASAWEAANPGKALARRARRRALVANAPGTLSPDIVDRLLVAQKGRCACCRQPLGSKYHLDYIMPLVLGGSNADDNMQLLRATCNLQKHAKHPVDFMQSRGFLL